MRLALNRYDAMRPRFFLKRVGLPEPNLEYPRTKKGPSPYKAVPNRKLTYAEF